MYGEISSDFVFVLQIDTSGNSPVPVMVLIHEGVDGRESNRKRTGIQEAVQR